jgi:hypothetical protein
MGIFHKKRNMFWLKQGKEKVGLKKGKNSCGIIKEERNKHAWMIPT